jgi:hypothetical protein
MASTINPENINILYPIAGQDNDTQGFRDNFRNIRNNLNAARQEITELQANVSYAPKITYVSNNVNGSVDIPTSTADSGVRGQMAFDNNYVYICVAANTWRRANLSTWS